MKSAFKTIAQRNRVIDRIIDAIVDRDDFLLIGHKNADEDCLASMVAMGLLISKFGKRVSLCLCQEIHSHFQYLLNICRFNSINILKNGPWTTSDKPTIIVCDTPKEDLLDICMDTDCLQKKDLLKIEIDHHLGADSQYIGDHGYCLVDEAISSTELVGILALKLNNRKSLLKEFGVEDFLSRNFVLAVLTGLVGDSRMGQYLKTRREKWFYRLFSRQFEEMLTSKTYETSGNFSTMEELYQAMESLSSKEEECYIRLMKYAVRTSAYVFTLVVDEKDMSGIFQDFSQDTVVHIVKNIADELAEESGYLSLVAYYDEAQSSNLIQFRMRRSKLFQKIDLRDILEVFKIENGGGHPGAIGFRKEKDSVNDVNSFIQDLVRHAEKVIADM